MSRITSSMMVRTTLRDLNQAFQRLEHTQSRITSGKQLLHASDDPTAAADAMHLRGLMRRNDQYQRSLDDAQSWLSTADSTLTSTLDRLVRAKELVVAASNSGGIASGNARQAFAAELSAIRDDLIAVANTKHGDRSIFAGTASGAAYTQAGVYLGNGDPIVRDVAPQTTLEVNVTGEHVFGTSGAGAGSLFEVLDRMAAAVLGGDVDAIATEHVNLDAAVDRIGAAAVEVGARSVRLESIRTRAEDDRMHLTGMLAEAEDVNVVEALIQVQSQRNAYEAALQVAAKIMPASLLNYLR